MLTLSVDMDGTTDRITGSAVDGGTVTCSEEAFVNLLGTLAQRANHFVVVTGSFGLGTSCSPTPSRWSAQVMGNGPFNPGMASRTQPHPLSIPTGQPVVAQSSVIVRLVPAV